MMDEPEPGAAVQDGNDGGSGRRTDPPRWLLVAVGVLAAAALAFGIGRFTAFGTSPAPATPGSTSADAGFARDMQVHHAQAIDMAMTIYRTTDDDQLRTMAYDIATGQAAQSGQLYEWLAQWGLPQAGGRLMAWMDTAVPDAHAGHGAPAATGQGNAAKTDAELRAEMGMATDAEVAELKAATGTTADCLFLSLMIRHHEGAVHMADAVIELGTQQRVKDVASAMKETQSAEIDAMHTMQTRLGCTG